MNLKDRIKADMKSAMRNRDIAKRDTLRNIQALIKQIEVDERRDVNDSDIESILMKYAKQREDAIKQFKSANRDDLVQKEMAELLIIKEYMPKQLSDEELKEAVSKIVKNVGATSIKDMGKVMDEAKKRLKNSADGARINQIAKAILI